MPFDLNKLTVDVAAALQAGSDAAANVDDNGICNFDGVVLRLPNLQESKVVGALKSAGATTSGRTNCGYAGVGYMINPTSPGQANKRSAAMEAIYKHLKDAGYSVSPFYMMD